MDAEHVRNVITGAEHHLRCVAIAVREQRLKDAQSELDLLAGAKVAFGGQDYDACATPLPPVCSRDY